MLASLSIASSSVRGAELVVGPDAQFAEIQEAVDAASPGDRISVHAGTYQPVVIATDGLVIAAATPRSRPVVDAAGSTIAVHVMASGVEVRGLEARNAVGEEDSEYGFLLTGDNNRLVDNTAVDDTHGFGIFQASGNTLRRNEASGNELGGSNIVGLCKGR